MTGVPLGRKQMTVLILCMVAVSCWMYLHLDVTSALSGENTPRELWGPKEQGWTPRFAQSDQKLRSLSDGAYLNISTERMSEFTPHNIVHEQLSELLERFRLADKGTEAGSGNTSNDNKLLKRLKQNIPKFKITEKQRQKRPVVVNHELMHDKWIVVTSVAAPTDDIKFLANITGWRMVVVGDTKTPSNWSYPNCVFLSVADQEKLGLSITSRLPYRSYSRKNVGYLFAVAHGAKVIYETDDDNRPLDQLKSFHLEPAMSGLMYAGAKIFNPYRHFGQPTLWPRGYPLGAVGMDVDISYRISKNWKTPSIQQGVVNGDPDTDALFRLTRKKTFSRLEVNFDKAAPPVILPEGVFSPFNSQNTLFLYDALWALILPVTTTFRICDIWRGYWAQRLLWEINGRLAFFPPNAYQIRNAHSYMADAEEENVMYADTQRLLDFLTEWNCAAHFSFFQCVYILSLNMAEHQFWQVDDVEMAKLWLSDLLKIGYQEPLRVNLTEEINPIHEGIDKSQGDIQQKSSPSQLELTREETLHNGIFATFVAAEQVPPSVHEDKIYNVSKISQHTDAVAAFCKNLTRVPQKISSLRDSDSRFFHDILLIVIFNWPHFSNVKFLEVAFRHIFPNIAYCGTNASLFYSSTANMRSNFTFIGASTMNGLLGHKCTIEAMQMGYNVKGYLVIGDDDLLNFWNFFTFDKDRLWVDSAHNIFTYQKGTRWPWWKHPLGKKVYMSTLNWIAEDKEVPNGVKKPRDFLATHINNTGGPRRVVRGIEDVYYIPSRLKDSSLYYLTLFANKHLMLEMALSTLFFGLERIEEMQFFRAVNLWGGNRSNPWKFYAPEIHVLHPVKLSTKKNKVPFCSVYLPDLLTKGHGQVGLSMQLFQEKQKAHQLQLKQCFEKLGIQ